MRRFLWHVLPSGFKRIRHYGLTANRKKAQAGTLSHAPQCTRAGPRTRRAGSSISPAVSGHDPTLCQNCHIGQLTLIRHLTRPICLPELRATGLPLYHECPNRVASLLVVVRKGTGHACSRLFTAN